jgi:GntR family transcriptional regulator/MocR family aminotransferase
MCNSVYIEEPSVEFTKDIFKMMGYKINCLEVDSSGACVEVLEGEKEFKLALLTPSHQFPTGSILPVKRRLKMIEIAQKNSAFIIEDDYDSEFRFKGLPIQPLQVLSPSRVIYTGTFSKNMAPSLRLGYLIVAQELISRFKRIKSRLNMRTPTIEQKAMAEFIKSGCLERHIYRMKNIYSKRRTFLSSMLHEYYGNNAAILGDEAGMHIKVEFLQQAYNYIDWRKSIEYGVEIDSIEDFCIRKGNNRNKIILGYGSLDIPEIEEGVNRLYRFTSSFLKQYGNV